MKPFSISSLMAFSAMLTAAGGPVITKTSPVVSMRVTPDFSWMSLMLAPLGPMILPILASGTWMVTTDWLASFSLAAASSTALPAAFLAEVDARPLRMASTDRMSFAAAAIPGMVLTGAMPGTTFLAIPAARSAICFSWSAFSLRFVAFLLTPAASSHSPPVPSSMMTNGSISTGLDGGASTFGGSALALATLALALAFGSGSGALVGSA
mmetsp:Transcript_56381/g.101319  ORF Transcript_56381/g.101319 Transcript_56381/m.101319 type:complete len:210 (+) Transcript_56381:356-985(+)